MGLVLPDHFSVSFTLRAVASEMQPDFQNCNCWMWNLTIGKSSTHLSLSTLRGRNWLIFALWEAVFEIRSNFQNQVPEIAHILYFYPRRLKLSLFLPHWQWFLRHRPSIIFGAWNFAIIKSYRNVQCTIISFLVFKLMSSFPTNVPDTLKTPPLILGALIVKK